MPARFGLINILKVLIVLFWGFMAFLLIQRLHLAPAISLAPGEELADSESWMSIYFKGEKIGFSEQSLARSTTGYTVNQNTYMRLNLMGEIQEIRNWTTARLTETMGLKSFNFIMSAGPISFQLSGQMKGLTLNLTSTTGGHKSQSAVELTEVPRLASGVMPYMTQKGLKKGERYKIPIFDPTTLSSRNVLVVVEDEERLIIDGQKIDTFRVRMDYLDTKTYTWVDTEGRTIKEEGLLGLSLVRTTEEEAREGIAGRSDLSDVVAATSVPVDQSMENPREVRFLRARLKGVSLENFELDGGRQILKGDVIEITRENIDVRNEVRLPIKSAELKPYLVPTNFVQSRHPKVLNQARKLTAGIKSPLKVIDVVLGWVYTTLEKRPTMSVPSAVDVLETKVGDCNEHAVLTAALLRAAGVPTKVAVGVLYFAGRFYYHAWLEVYWGRWMAIDPVLGQIPADATHIRFITGGLARQTDIVRIMGRLEIEILETR